MVWKVTRNWLAGLFLSALAVSLAHPAQASVWVTEAWMQRYNGPGNNTDNARAVAVDGNGNVYVTGRSWGGDTGWDYATISYGPDGKERWVRRYTGPGREEDTAGNVVVDGSGNIYVTGCSWGADTAYDYVTISYAPDGTERWVRRYNGRRSGFDIARSVAVDGSGNVYVTGWSWGGDTGWDYATVSYGPDGTERWVRRYTGPGKSDAMPYGLAVDGSGNVYVSGFSWGGDTGFDGTTVGYSFDGTERWVRRYTGEGNSRDWAISVAVDGNGNVYVAGFLGDSGAPEDYVTVKYTEVPNVDPVVPANRVVSVDEDDPNTPLGIAAPTDADGDPLTITVTAVPDSSRAFVRRFGGGTAVAVDDVLTVGELVGLELEVLPNVYGDAGNFQYVVTDGKNGFASQTLGLGILPVNDAPVAQEEGYATPQSTLLVVAAPGILGNDGDVEEDPLAAQLVSGPTSGDLTLNADGSFRYTPSVGFTGTDTFTYQASDGAAVSAPATVTITVSAEPPAATDKARVQGNGKLGTGKKAPSFSLNVRVLASGKIKGKVRYKDAGTVLQSTRLTSVVVNGAHARIFGEGKLKGAGTVAFVLDVYDQSRTKADRKQGKADRFQLQTSGAVSVSETALTQGNLRVW